MICLEGCLFLSVYQFDVHLELRQELRRLWESQVDLHLKGLNLQGKDVSDCSELLSGVLLSFVAR